MASEFIPAEVMNQKGMELPPKVVAVERGAIQDFAEAIGDDNPIYYDEEYAKRSHYGAMIVPPTFLVKLTIGLAKHYKWNFGRVGVHGGEEYEYLKPIKAGDTITCRTKIEDIYEKDGKKGKMAFMVLRSDLENQHGEVVARIKRKRISME
jgi:acyl dehydratase